MVRRVIVVVLLSVCCVAAAAGAVGVRSFETTHHDRVPVKSSGLPTFAELTGNGPTKLESYRVASGWDAPISSGLKTLEILAGAMAIGLALMTGLRWRMSDA